MIRPDFDLPLEIIYQTIADATFDWEDWYDDEGRLLYVSPACERISGYRPQDFIADQNLIEKIIFPEDLPVIREHQRIVRADPMHVCEIEYRIIRRDGQVRWISHYCQPAFLPDGRRLGRRGSNRDFTHLKEAQIELRRSRQQLQVILDGISDTILAFDAQGNLIYGNPAGLEATRPAPDRFLQNAGEFSHAWEVRDEAGHVLSEDERPLYQGLRGIATSPMVLHYCHRLTGQERWVIARATPIQNAQGSLEMVIYIAHDVSRLIQSEAELRASQERYRAIFEHSLFGILLADLGGRIIEVNSALLRMSGFDPEDISPNVTTAAFFASPQEAERIGAIFDSQGYLYQQETQLRRKDGSLFDVLLTITPVEIHGQAYLQVIVEDISELKHTQRELQRIRNEQELLIRERTARLEQTIQMLEDEIIVREATEKALQAERDFVEGLIQTAQAILLVLDRQGRIVRANPYLEQVSGFRQEEFIGKDWFTTFLPPRDRDRIRALFAKALRGERTRGNINPIVTRDGQERMVEWFDHTLRNSQGEVIGLLAIGQDVTERLRNQALMEQNARRAAILARLAERINTEKQLSGVLDAVLDEAISCVDYDAAMILLSDGENELLEHTARLKGPIPASAPRIVQIPLSLYIQMIEMLGEPAIIPDIQALEGIPHAQMLREANVRTLIMITMYEEEALMGTLVLASIGEIRLPTPEEGELLEALAKQAALGIAKARLISDLTEAQKNLRHLSEQLMRVQEEERRSLARELHDEVGQQLTLLSSRLSQACQSLAEGPEATGVLNQLEQSHELVKQLIAEVRDLSFTLRPSLLDDLGLLPTLHAYFERYAEQSGIQVNFRHTGVDRRFPPQIETTAFRTIQEALTNVLRYANVTQASVRLWADSETLLIQIEDQGVGFDAHRLIRHPISLGLAGMRERVLACHGHFDVQSEIGRGTCLTMILPLHEKPEEE